MKSAILIGATGLIGKALLNQLLTNSDYAEIRVFTRRSTGVVNSKLKEYIVDFNNIESVKKEIVGDVLFSTMGTTLKTAGSKEKQWVIDYDYQYNTAKLACENGVKKLVLLSSMGANSGSKIFYSKMKGELDEAVQQLGYSNVSIIRPSMLEGNREEFRWAEKVFTPIMKGLVVVPCWRKYRPVKDSIVAKAMINAVDFTKKSHDIYEGNHVFLLADSVA